MKQNSLRLAIKTIPYALSFKSSVISAAILTVLGLGMLIFGALTQTPSILSVWFMIIPSIYVIQMLYSIYGLSSLAMSSAHRKSMLTKVPAVLYTLFMMAAYLLLVLADAILLHLAPADENSFTISLLIGFVVMFVLTIYVSFSFRYFIVSLIMLFIIGGSMGAFTSITIEEGFTFATVPLPFAAVAALGIVVVLLCGGIFYMISLLLYKRSVSDRIYAAQLKKAGHA